MKKGILPLLISLMFSHQLSAQRACDSYTYLQNQLNIDPTLQSKLNSIEEFTRQHISTNNIAARPDGSTIITIPVVVHILYHDQAQDISDAVIKNQIDILTRDFRRKNSDTANTPVAFRPVAADCEIEFKLAISDPQRRSTTGIVRKYTPILQWEQDDKMKFNSEMGDDAWDSKSYLNIWVCNIMMIAGYSSVVGGPANKDGVVISFNAFGTVNTAAGYDMGRTTVHEVGHWLNLRHTWGDAYCGDDFVDDTPKQSTFTPGCPSGIRVSCGNSPTGDMYMNYMDFTNDACMNLFTQGQKARMRALFAPGGPRFSILSSTGLSAPLINEIPLPYQPPRWLYPQVYPNPSTSELYLDLAYDPRWIGKEVNVMNVTGEILLHITITSTLQKIDITKLQPGIYIISGNRDADRLRQKFVKL